jgi:hypothetical protein
MGAVRKGFEAGKIHYEGLWKGWKSRRFWALKWLGAKPKNVELFPSKLFKTGSLASGYFSLRSHVRILIYEKVLY